MQTFALIVSFFIVTSLYGQEKDKSVSFSQSTETTDRSTEVQIKYSATFDQHNFEEVCKTISSEYPEFTAQEEDSGEIEYIRDHKSGYLEIEVKRRGKVQMVLETNDPENPNIEKFHKLEKRLDSY